MALSGQKLALRSSAAMIALGLTAMAGGPAAALDVAKVKPEITRTLDAEYSHLDALYKHIHAHPELAFQETQTAARLAEEMRALGFKVTEHVGKTGLVAIYRNGEGPTVMVRTELDALPMREKTGLPYASHVTTMWNGHETPVAHSCGHDIHMASWVGTAKELVSMKDQWHGTLMFIAQPAEETVSGAKAMMADGLYTRFGKPDYAFALHDSPIAYGTLRYKAGVLTSNSDSLEITFKGRGGHGAMPNLTIDPVVIAAHFVTDLQSVISREKDPAKFGVVSIGAIQGGTAENIIPDHVLLRGTIRSFDPDVRKKMIEGIRRTAKAVADMAGAPAPEVKITEGAKAVINEDALTARTVKVLKAAFGDAIKPSGPTYASEDFSAFEQPGIHAFFFTIGVYPPQKLAAAIAAGKRGLPPNHSPMFAPVPEPTIKTGVTAMTLAVLNVMQGGGSAEQADTGGN